MPRKELQAPLPGLGERAPDRGSAGGHRVEEPGGGKGRLLAELCNALFKPNRVFAIARRNDLRPRGNEAGGRVKFRDVRGL